MSDFENEDDILAYRRLCQAITQSPDAWERLLKNIAERSLSNLRRTSCGRVLFKQSLDTVKKIGKRLAAEETDYWQQK